MTDRDATHEPQSSPAERALRAHTTPARRSWLAAEAVGVGFLFPLEQAGEIFTPVEVLPLPHTQPWFWGVANLRGGLHGIVDLASFLRLRPRGGAEDAHKHARGRLIAISPTLRALCALHVDQLAGLRHRDDMTPVPAADPAPAFAGALWRDANDRLWQEIDLAELVASDAFLSIAAVQPA
jgi:twitching motility protein PilI